MTTPAIPDFSDIFSPKPKVDSTTAQSDSVTATAQVPSFSDIFAAPKPQTGAYEEEVLPRLKGIWGGAKAIGDFGANLYAMAAMGPAGDPNFAPLKERRTMIAEQTKAALTGLSAGIKKGVTDWTTIPPAIADLVHGMIVTPAEDMGKFLTGNEPGSGGESVSFAAGKNGEYAPATYPTHLKPEELEEATKQTTAVVASVYIGGLATSEIADGLSGLRPFVKGKGLKAIAQATTPAEVEAAVAGADLPKSQLFDMNKAGTMNGMPWAQRTIAKLGGDVTGGFTYGYMSAPDDQRMSAGITMAMIAAPLGLIHAGITESRMAWKGSSIDNFQLAREAAFNMASVREWNGIWNKTPAAIFEDMDVLQQVKLLQAAQARNLITYRNVGYDENGIMIRQGENAGIVPGVSGETLPEVLKQTTSEPGRTDVTAFVHARGDGFHDVYIGPTDTPADVKDFFEKTGYVQGQPVTYGGNERLMIDTAERNKNGDYTLTLFDPITEQRMPGVLPSEVVRPANKYIGELALYQNKKLSLADITDPALGIGMGGNLLAEGITREPIKAFQEHGVNATLMSLTEHELVFNQDGNPVAAKRIYHAPGQPDEIPLKPGINEITRVNAHDPTRIEGATVYLSSEGTITGVLGWTETQRPTGGRIKRVSDAWNWKDPSSPAKATDIMKETSAAMRKYRAENNLDVSNSTMSVGAQKAAIRRINASSWVGREYTEFGVYDLEPTLRDLTTGFLDHIGFVDGDIHIDPSEVIDRIGIKRTQAIKGAQREPSAIGGIGKSINNIERAREGIPETYGVVRGGPVFKAQAGVRLEEEGKPLIDDEGNPLRGTTGRKQSTAREAIAAETEAGHTPEVASRARRRLNDPLLFHQSLSFDDLAESYMKSLGVTPEVKPALKQHLEFALGKILEGDHNMLDKYTDKKTVNVWKSFIDNTEKARVAYDQLTATHDFDKQTNLIKDIRKKLGFDDTVTDAEINFHIQEAEKTAEVLRQRVKQLESPIPLELSKEDMAAIKDLKAKAVEERKGAVANLMHLAHAANMYVERGYDGAVFLRDMDTHKKISESFRNETDATQWVRDTGGARGLDLDGGSGNNLIPPETVGDILPPKDQGPRPNEVPYEFTPDTWFGKLASYFDRAVPWLAAKRATFTSYDNGFGTKFYEDVYQPLQTAKMLSQAKKNPHRIGLKNVEDLLKSSGVDRKDWGRIGDYRNTMSANDIDKHMFGDRFPNQAEKDMSQQLANMHIDTQSVYEYVRDVAELKKQSRVAAAQLDPAAPDTPQKQQALQQKLNTDLQQLQVDANMDAAHLNAAQMFEFAQAQDPKDFKLHVATRRANSIMSKEFSRDEFAKFHKMTPAEIKAARMLDGLDASLLAEAGISPSFRDYVQHQLHEGTPVNADLLTPDEKVAATVASKFVGDGEIGLSERDPILNSANLINKLIDHKYFDNAWNAAQAATRKNILTMPREARDLAARVAGEYVFGLRGIPSAEERYSKEMVRSYFDDIGLTEKGGVLDSVHEQIINDFSNTLLSASSAALIGFRPAQGIRDLHGFMRNYYARVGGARLADGFRLAFTRNPATGRLPIYELAEKGTIPGLSILQFLSEQEVADAMAGAGSHGIRDAVQKAARVGLITSGQHNVYAVGHAVAYLETRSFAGKVVLDLSRDKITKAQAYKKLKLDTFDIPVAQGFDNLVTQGKFNEATEYLAQASGTENAFVYGLQNQPLGWGTGFGRLMGHLGQWSIWDRDFLTRLASRGSAAQRYAAMARYAVAEAGLFASGRATGINVKSWYGVPGIIFAGSPLVGLAGQVNDMIGLRGKQKQRQALSVYGGRVPVITQFLPGATAFSDYYQAYQLGQARYGPLPVIAKGLGFSIDRSQRSLFDEMTDQYPKLAAK